MSILLDHVNHNSIVNALVHLIENNSKRKNMQSLVWSNYKFSAKISAIALPIPREPPVINETVLGRLCIILVNSRMIEY